MSRSPPITSPPLASQAEGRSPRLSRDLRLLALSDALRRYAARLQPDLNAAGLLAHRAIAAAFAKPVAASAADAKGAMEAGLRAHVDGSLADQAAKTPPPGRRS
ncbi:hypothetical protein DMC25_25325 [Caulobacter sp. D4A]|uniref:hypothetical protein n=1 Tax=unclassified Caulobacter TaxID=2648921 RepID=UPI000D735295|nr:MULTISPECIES: hypothetical protein [unclassified Caulobacter]PXA74385.1 hypothetical protein DMC25_25325 [Caulobacter sp. D4A]PXA88078.1 hypothetical protein DMC18_19780 [Caulobacter sp. D5]